MKTNDLVRIVKQPSEMSFDVVNKVGYIEEVQEGIALFQGITLTGDYDGSGGIPLDCLEMVEDVNWINAYFLFKDKVESNNEKLNANRTAVTEMLSEIGKRYNLTGDQVWMIFSEVQERKEKILEDNPLK